MILVKSLKKNNLKNNIDYEANILLFLISDQEQRKLYEAAKVIQNAYRQYRDKQQLLQQRQKEIEAAILIQSYYRRYKQVSLKDLRQKALKTRSLFISKHRQYICLWSQIFLTEFLR